VQKNLDEDFNNYNPDLDPSLSKVDRTKIALIKELKEVLQNVYLNQDALDEVNAAIYSSYEPDESISITSLLSTNRIGLYNHPAFLEMKIKTGTFKEEFLNQLNVKSYPLIEKYYSGYLTDKLSSSVNGGHSDVMAALDSLPLEVFNVSGIKIYFPYSENWGSLYNPGTPGLNTVTDQMQRLVTLVAADREADSGPGNEPYYYQAGRDAPRQLRWRTVTVNDNYAELTKATHIINVMDVRSDPAPPPNPPISGVTIYKVYLGWVKCTKQYDKLISFSNGGGSELRFGRGFAIPDASGNVTAGFNFFPVNMKRKEIRKGTWKQVLTLWDTNWTTDKVEQPLCIYEDDNNDPSTLTSTVSYSNNGVTTSVNVSSTVRTNDPVIRNFIINRNFYFGTGTTDQGWGFQSQWPIFDGNTNVMYTLPYEVINL
jgi:hypothetical protein